MLENLQWISVGRSYLSSLYTASTVIVKGPNVSHKMHMIFLTHLFQCQRITVVELQKFNKNLQYCRLKLRTAQKET